MGAGASANGGDATIFTSLKDEMEKPRDGSDVATPRGVSALEEVKRLRGLLASKTAEAGDEHGEAGEHRMRMKKVKRKLSITEDFQSRSPKKVHEASRRQFHSPEGKVRKTLDNKIHVKVGFADEEHASVDELNETEKSELVNLSNWAQVSYADMAVAVLVSDLSGFTSTTRKYGILHFASIIVRMRQLCLPIFHRHGAMFITTEADNFLVIFSDALSAAKAGLEMQAVLKAYADTLVGTPKEHFKVRLNGVGIHYGYGVVVDKQGKLHGDVANTAYHIGEDLCENASVLMTMAMKNVIESHSDFQAATFVGVDEDCFRVEGAVGGLDCELVPTTDMTWLHPNCADLVSRHSPDADVAALDEKLTASTMRSYTALMFEFEFNEVEAEYGAEQGLVLKFFALERMVTPILTEMNGIALEDVLWIFKDSTDAVKAAVKLKAALVKYNEAHPEKKDKINISGYGIHIGTMVFIEGTDIHWGDPVNTSSKLGQDLARDGDILITEIVHTHLQENPALLEEISFQSKTLRRSGVEFLAYLVVSKE